ncbi:Regulator of G protein signaling superfamily [Pleurostoma richardsiae]|uniref:Regulator of G protein signaling superfamily n=1 Tax=Pleurostoma richardsiae TaxID=41990 RepID=A0AA38VWB7_9PEZI|nr:Regulator of G protein signaling superfamily [Pleurostoma richardsiae]
MGILGLGYRRPAYVDKDEFKKSHQEPPASPNPGSPDSIRSGRSSASAGIPDALTFDKIMNGGTCPPCTVRDFMNYLIYVERSAENLQFFLWYRDYVKRFNDAKTSDISLAPEWTQTMEEEALFKIQKEHAEKIRREPAVVGDIFKGTDFEKSQEPVVAEIRDPFGTPPQTPRENGSDFAPSNLVSIRSQVSDAFNAAGVKQPFTIQPFREEIDRVIATYIMDDAPRQLNLSSKEQKAVLQALAYTTHPSAFRMVARSVESTLRQQAHPNFIRWSICNGNHARVCFAWTLGMILVAAGFVLALLLTLSSAPRGWRALAALGWLTGISTLVGAYKGMCVVLHGMHHRHVRPWELFVDEEQLDEMSIVRKAGDKHSFDSFGSANSYEDEPWIVRYERRNVVRKIFDREIWIQEPALRQIQDTIFVQSVLAALLGTGALTALFVAVPGGGFY